MINADTFLLHTLADLPARFRRLKAGQIILGGRPHARSVTCRLRKTKEDDRHIMPELCCVVRGEKIMQAGDHCYRMRTGDFCLVPRMLRHYSWPVKADQPYQVLIFGFAQIQRLWVLYAGHSRQRGFHELAVVHFKTPPALVRMLDGRDLAGPADANEARAALAQLAALLAEKTIKRDYFLSPVQDVGRTWRQRSLASIQAYIREHPHEKLTLQSIAERFSLSVRSLVHLFKREYSDTLFEHIIYTRLARARELLADPRLTVTQIAEQLNYQDAYFFSKQFKKFFGLAPTAYRNAYL